MKLKYIINPIFILIISACEIRPIVDTNIDNILIVSGYLTPINETCEISVRKALKLNTPQNIDSTSIKDAIVKLLVKNKTYPLLYNPKTEYYEGPRIFNAGDTVSLIVQHRAITATSTTIIPKQINDIVLEQLNDGVIKFSWTNDGERYHQIFVEKATNEGQKIDFKYKVIAPYKFIFKTKVTDKIAIHEGILEQINLLSTPYKQLEVDFKIASLDSNYYYFNLAQKDAFGIGPFQDRSSVFNNIKNGVGIFASYNFTTFKTKLK